MKLHNYIHDTLGFSEYEIAQMKYLVNSILSELSKLLLIGIFFIFVNKFSLFLVATFILCMMRSCTGGLHFSHYISCLAMSFSIFYIGICILCSISITKPVQLILLLLCMPINYISAPVVSAFRPIPDKDRIQKSKKRSLKLLILFLFLLCILPKSQYVDAGFWMIILQTIQLFVAKIFKKEVQKNETTDNVFSN